MRSTPSSWLRLFWVGAALLLSAVAAQAPARVRVIGAATPVKIEIASPGGVQPGRPFSFVLANTSVKPIAGIVVAITYFDQAGKAHEGPSQITARSLAAGEPGLPPAGVMDVHVRETYVIGSPAQGVLPARAELSVDYVLFMDGTTWGADRTRMSVRLAAMRTGAAMERERLATLLRQAGAAALVAQLGSRGPLGGR